MNHKNFIIVEWNEFRLETKNIVESKKSIIRDIYITQGCVQND